MPACDARYDVILDDGYSTYRTARPRTEAVLDFEEQREPDDWGEPGPLLSARLVWYWASAGKRIHYETIGTGARKRNALWVDGTPTRVSTKHRRWLRWKHPEYDPPIDPDYEDPA